MALGFLRRALWAVSEPSLARDRVSIPSASWLVWRKSCRSQSGVGLFVGSCVNLRTTSDCSLGTFWRSKSFGNSSTVSLWGRVLIFIFLDLFLFGFSLRLAFFWGDMAEVNQSMVKTVNIHQSKIDVVKFDGTNNFDMWKCEVIDLLNVQNLKDTLLLQEKSAETTKKD